MLADKQSSIREKVTVMSQTTCYGAKESLRLTTGVEGQTGPFPAFQLEGLE